MRIHKTFLAVALGALLVLPAAWWATRTTPGESILTAVSSASPVSEPEPISTAEIDSLRLELAKLRAGFVALDGRIASGDSGDTEDSRGLTPASVSPAPDHAPDAPETVQRDVEDSRRDQITALEDRIVGEQSDRSFEDNVVAELTEAFVAQEIEGVAIAQAACGESLCRIDLDFDNSLVLEDGMAQLPHLLPWASEGFVSVDDQDPNLVAVYAMRAGSPLPVVE
jgi:hypothetical protein